MVACAWDGVWLRLLVCAVLVRGCFWLGLELGGFLLCDGHTRFRVTHIHSLSYVMSCFPRRMNYFISPSLRCIAVCMSTSKQLCCMCSPRLNPAPLHLHPPPPPPHPKTTVQPPPKPKLIYIPHQENPNPNQPSPTQTRPLPQPHQKQPGPEKPSHVSPPTVRHKTPDLCLGPGPTAPAQPPGCICIYLPCQIDRSHPNQVFCAYIPGCLPMYLLMHNTVTYLHSTRD